MGRHLARAVATPGLVELAGLTPICDSDAVHAQTLDVLRQIDEILAEAGTDREHLTRVIVWLRDMDDFAEMNRAWREWFDGITPPARATAEVKLADPSWRLEMIATAHVPQ